MTMLHPDEIKTASLYPRATFADRIRGTSGIVITRYWPRGLKRHTTDYTLAFMPNMAPSAELLATYRNGVMTWEQFANAYRFEVGPYLPTWRKGINDLLSAFSYLEADEHGVTLLCHEHDAPEDTVRCHRRLLREMLLGGDTNA